MTLGDPVAAHAASCPDKHAVITVDGDAERVTTYAALDARANRLANLLAAWGVGEGERVAVMLPNGAEWFETNLAAARLRARLVPVNWHLTQREIGWILADADTRVLISHRTFAATAGDALDAAPRCAALWVDDGYEQALAGAPCDPPTSAGAPAPGLVLYTSGTTGRPKGVVHEQTTTTRTRADHVALWGFTADDVHLLAGPAYHGAPWSFAVTHLALGATVIALTRWDAATFVGAVDRHRATNTFLVPTHFARLLELTDTSPAAPAMADRLSSLRLVLHGAAACPVLVKQRILDLLPDVDVCEFYGFSEAGRVTRIDPEEWRTHPGSCGRPIEGVQVLVLDDQGRELPVGETGTIWVVPGGGRFHYRGNDEATAAVTRATRLGTAVTGGDVGRLDADGYLYVTDRSVDLVVRGGVNVYPREVEDALLEHPAIADCAVLGIPDDVYGERIVALVETAEGLRVDAHGIDAHCRAHLASFKCPEEYRFLTTLPRDPNGKVRKGQLRDWLRSDASRSGGGGFDPAEPHS